MHSIAGKTIICGCLIANEIINMAKLDDQRLLLLKVDFEKAFDIVNWDFLHDIMAQMGFGVKWRKWIGSCLSSATISVLINGSPSKEFYMERGLRQGDPLSLLLFLLVVEALQASGLKVNLAKSRLFGVGVDIHEVELVASSINCSYGTLPFMYLGILVGKNMHFCNGWTEVIDRLRDRLSSWKAKNLSIGGRLTLVKSVLGSVPLYFLSLFKAPLKVIKKLESIRCRFFWGFKDGDKGKWKWSFLIEGDALWRKVIKSFYGEDGGFNDSLRDGKKVVTSFNKKIVTGCNTLFWKDVWCKDGVRLMDRFPRLFALESNKDCFIFERWAHTNGVWRGVWMWRIPPCGRSLDDVSSLCSLISDLSLSSEGFDKWQWALNASGF
ncbi:RNA-directed DNA polymerase, eukaryota, reverse transcriptase zinc-binding domain protein [Tanacetum coccineum]